MYPSAGVREPTTEIMFGKMWLAPSQNGGNTDQKNPPPQNGGNTDQRDPNHITGQVH